MKISLTTEVPVRKKVSFEVENTAYVPGWVASRISKQCSVCLYEFEDNETVAVLTFKTTNGCACVHGRCLKETQE